MIVCSISCRPEPNIPVKKVRNRLLFQNRFPNRINRTIAPNVGFLHLADRPRLDQFHCTAIRIPSMNLRSHLGRNLTFLFGILFLHPPGLLYRMGKWFLTINMLPGSHRGDRCKRVMMIRRANDHRINFRVAHDFPPISRCFGILKLCLDRLEDISVNITERVDVLALHSIQVRTTTTT